ncbi:hypothetical protein [Streptomyces sp. CC219B]|uniref:hypothetical protein n=1 Tax=Streptomyces sp. CC219B TaxID=3044574 RepID=UPI0024A9CA49|nr:hypothetical protein [Streptomyces sp. CC219B]
MPKDQWFYPDDLEGDLRSSPLPPERRAETLAHTWEYNRCVVPEFTNWDRYIALARLGGIAIVAEVFGDLVDVLSHEPVLGYDVDALLDTLFGDSDVREPMAREYRASLLMMTEKSTGRRDTELMRRYVDALAHSPQDWFRLRDCDGMFRFYVAAAIACNDDDAHLTEDENRLITEIGEVLYDAVAFHKHRAEGEIHNTYAYVGAELRESGYRSYREALWALDARWARTTRGRCAVNFARFVGGPIHQMMRRYRFVEDGLVVGKPETADVVTQARRNAKLWYRIDARTAPPADKERYAAVLAQEDRVLFPGMLQLLNRSDQDKCPHCRHRTSYGAEAAGQFGGVELCEGCRDTWRTYLHTFPDRAARVLASRPDPTRARDPA